MITLTTMLSESSAKDVAVDTAQSFKLAQSLIDFAESIEASSIIGQDCRQLSLLLQKYALS